MTKHCRYYICDICGKKINADDIPSYNTEFVKATLKIDGCPPKLPYSKTIDVCTDCVIKICKGILNYER